MRFDESFICIAKQRWDCQFLIQKAYGWGCHSSFSHAKEVMEELLGVAKSCIYTNIEEWKNNMMDAICMHVWAWNCLFFKDEAKRQSGISKFCLLLSCYCNMLVTVKCCNPAKIYWELILSFLSKPNPKAKMKNALTRDFKMIIGCQYYHSFWVGAFYINLVVGLSIFLLNFHSQYFFYINNLIFKLYLFD